jgi:hypothetical protein
MIGSEIFIMVALRCSESRTPSALAMPRSARRRSGAGPTFITEESMTSPLEQREPVLEQRRLAVVADELDACTVVGLQA